MRGGHRGLPVGTLVQLAVADHHERVEVLLADACAERHAHRDRESVAEAAGAHLDAGKFEARVHAERRLESVEPVEHRCIDEAGVREDGAERGVRVALRQDEAIAVGPAGLRGPHAHPVEVQRCEDVRRGRRSAGVSAAARAQCAPDAAPHVPRGLFESMDQRFTCFGHRCAPGERWRSGGGAPRRGVGMRGSCDGARGIACRGDRIRGTGPVHREQACAGVSPRPAPGSRTSRCSDSCRASGGPRRAGSSCRR